MAGRPGCTLLPLIPLNFYICTLTNCLVVGVRGRLPRVPTCLSLPLACCPICGPTSLPAALYSAPRRTTLYCRHIKTL